MIRRLLPSALPALLALAAPVAAEATDPADLVPARTLAYLELRDPPGLARELHALVRGSYLRHPAALLAHHTREGKKIESEVFLLAWMGSAEFIDELGDVQGGCVAFTGLTRHDNPEIAAVLRTGRSRMLPLALRMALLDGGDVRCIGRVEGVPVFQVGDAEKPLPPNIARRAKVPAARLARLLRTPRRRPVYEVALLEEVPVEPPEEKPEFGCFVSLLPGAIVVGSTPEIQADTVRRLKGKPSGPSLRTVPAFRAAAGLRGRPGLFAWADPPGLARLTNDVLRRELLRRLDEIRFRPLEKGEKRDAEQVKQEVRTAEIEHRAETRDWALFQKVANPAGMQFAAASWSLHDGTFAGRLDVRMKDKQTSPLLRLLPDQKLSPELLRAVPGDAFALFAVPLPDAAAALPALLKLADSYAADEDDESPPSKIVRDWEKRFKLKLADDVLARIKSAAVAVHLMGGSDKEAGTYPVLLIEAADEGAAEKLLGLVPRLLGEDGEAAGPKRHTLGGQVVYSLTDDAANPHLNDLPAHYGRRGKVLALGWHRGGVATALRHSNRQKELLNLPRGRAAVEAEGAVGALGLLSFRQWLGRLAEVGSEEADQGPGHLRSLGYLRELSTPMATMPPTLFAVKRRADGLSVELRQAELPAASATVIDIALTWMLDDEAAAAFIKKPAGAQLVGFLGAVVGSLVPTQTWQPGGQAMPAVVPPGGFTPAAPAGGAVPMPAPAAPAAPEPLPSPPDR